MSLREVLDLLEKVASIAQLAGLRGQVEEDRLHYRMGFETGEGRSQTVFVRVSGQTPPGEPVVTFLSPCLTVKKGFLKGISKEQALDLLRQNTSTLFARFGIWSTDEHDMIVASLDHILPTLDPREFEASAGFVAIAADKYEREHGKADTF